MKFIILYLLILTTLIFAQDNEQTELSQAKQKIEKLTKELDKTNEKISSLEEKLKAQSLLQKDTSKLSLIERLDFLENENQKLNSRLEIVEDKTEKLYTKRIIHTTYISNTYDEAVRNLKIWTEKVGNGRSFSFSKREAKSILRLSYCDNFQRVDKNNSLLYVINIDGKPKLLFGFHTTNNRKPHYIPSTLIGYIKGIKKGNHKISIKIPNHQIMPGGITGKGTYYNGWYSNFTLQIEEIAAKAVELK